MKSPTPVLTPSPAPLDYGRVRPLLTRRRVGCNALLFVLLILLTIGYHDRRQIAAFGRHAQMVYWQHRWLNYALRSLLQPASWHTPLCCSVAASQITGDRAIERSGQRVRINLNSYGNAMFKKASGQSAGATG